MEKPKPQITFIGTGSWATALIKIITEKSVRIKWYWPKKEDVEFIKQQHQNPRYLTDVQLSASRVRPTTSLLKAIEETEFLFLVSPAAFLSTLMEKVQAQHLEGKKIILAIKGMVPETESTVAEWLEQKYKVKKEQLAVIAGPCHAEEVALERLSYLTIASENKLLAEEIAAMLNCSFVRTCTNPDIIGVELAAIMKNIYAMCCGIAHGLGNGDNFQAVLVSNASRELASLLNSLYPSDRDVNESAYLGDLLVTAYSQFSRNRTFGNMIGRGYSVQSAQMEMKMIAEGYFALEGINKLIKQHSLQLPIFQAVYNIMKNKANPQKEMEVLAAELS